MRKKKIRFVYMVLVGLMISFVLHALVPNSNDDQNAISNVLVCILITAAVWEGNLRIDTWMDKHYSWVKSPGKRLLVHMPTSLLYSALMIFLSMMAYNTYVCRLPEATNKTFSIISLVFGVMISIILLSIEIGAQFFANWKNSLIEVEKYKAESLQAQFQNLKNQLNPHFLFNNMSVLSSLVYKDQDKAVDFINQLSKVYRYLLDNKNNELVDLETELNFIQSYMYLLQIRFDQNLKFDIQIPKEAMKLLLPPMALQMLIENAIKHNEVSEEQPLTITIVAKGDSIEVSNNLQKRAVYELSSKTGIQNIKERYHYFTERPVEVNESATAFRVRIPLLIGT